MPLLIPPGERGDGAATLTGAGSACRGRATASGNRSIGPAGFAGTAASLKIGAGCEPDCMNSALITMAVVAKATATKPITSFGLQCSRRNRNAPWRPAMSASISRLLPPSVRDALLATFAHRSVCLPITRYGRLEPGELPVRPRKRVPPRRPVHRRADMISHQSEPAHLPRALLIGTRLPRCLVDGVRRRLSER